MTAVETVTQPLTFALPDLLAREGESALAEVAAKISALHPGLDASAMERSFVERERLGSTAIGGGIALPHCRPGRLERAIVAIGRVPGGVDFGASDGLPVRLLVAILTPDGAPAIHLRLLAAVARRLRKPSALSAALSAPTPDSALAALELDELPELT